MKVYIQIVGFSNEQKLYEIIRLENLSDIFIEQLKKKEESALFKYKCIIDNPDLRKTDSIRVELYSEDQIFLDGFVDNNPGSAELEWYEKSNDR